MSADSVRSPYPLSMAGSARCWISAAAAGRVADRVEAVLPALVRQAPVGGPAVLDEPVAVPVAVPLDPGQRLVGGRQQPPYPLRIRAPAQALGEQHDVQRGGVDGAVV